MRIQEPPMARRAALLSAHLSASSVGIYRRSGGKIRAARGQCSATLMHATIRLIALLSASLLQLEIMALLCGRKCSSCAGLFPCPSRAIMETWTGKFRITVFLLEENIVNIHFITCRMFVFLASKDSRQPVQQGAIFSNYTLDKIWMKASLRGSTCVYK